MPVVSCRLGLDRADAASNRPVLVLRAPEVEALLAAAVGREAPRLVALLRDENGGHGGHGGRREPAGWGASRLPELRAELWQLLDGIAASRLPEQLTLAVALQRLDNACGTAQEFGFNLYVVVEDD